MQVKTTPALLQQKANKEKHAGHGQQGAQPT